MSKGEDRDFGGKGRRCKAVNTLEGDGKEFEMDSLMNSEPVQLLKVMRNVGSRGKVKNSSEGKVLDLLEFGEVRRVGCKKERIAIINFRSDDRVDQSFSSLRCKKLSNRSNIFENDKRGGENFRYV